MITCSMQVCPLRQLQLVREDSVFTVYAESPKYILPRELSDKLTEQYGNHFRVSLRRGVYVIYIDREAVKRRGDRNHGQHANDDNKNGDLVSFRCCCC